MYLLFKKFVPRNLLAQEKKELDLSLIKMAPKEEKVPEGHVSRKLLGTKRAHK